LIDCVVATALVAGGVLAGPMIANPTVAGAAPDDANASAPHAADSIDVAATELVSLETTTVRLQRESAQLVATRDADRAETAATKEKLAATKASRRDRAVHAYINSFRGEAIDDLLRPSVSRERLTVLTDAADRADQNGIRAMQARLDELADQLRATEDALQRNGEDQAASRERLETVKTKIAEGAVAIGSAGPVTPAAAAQGPIAQAARAAGDALRVADLATARAAAALDAARAMPNDPDVASVAFAAAAAQNQPRVDHLAKQQALATVIGDKTAADPATLEAVWVLTPAPALRAMYFALSQVGKDYVYATSGPDTYDCSGLTRRAWEENGIGIPHFSGAQLHVGTPVALADIRPGDLLAYGPDGSEHVVLSIGAGWDVEAKGTQWGVVVEKADTTSPRYAGASRPL
jgi:cell wall-associated NlpC family hydrolase